MHDNMHSFSKLSILCMHYFITVKKFTMYVLDVLMSVGGGNFYLFLTAFSSVNGF